MKQLFFIVLFSTISFLGFGQDAETGGLKIEVAQTVQQQVEINLDSTETTIVLPSIQPFPLTGGLTAIVAWFLNEFSKLVGLFVSLLVVVWHILRAIPTKMNLDFIIRAVEWLDKLKVFGFRISRNRRKGGGEFVVKTEEKGQLEAVK